MKYTNLTGLLLTVLTVFTATFFFAGAAQAAHLEGRVYDVIDGNTLYVLDGLDTPYVVRLASAPMNNGDARASKQRLVDLVFHKHVHVVWQQVDGQGRLLARVYVMGQDVVCYDPVCPVSVELGSAQTAPVAVAQ